MFPALNVRLEDLDEPLVKKAQRLPEEVVAGGAERVLSLTDRVWFKVKTTDQRGAAGELESVAGRPVPRAAWWLAASGHRKADTAHQDFYELLAMECRRRGKGSGHVSTDQLLPVDTDYRRWQAELAALTVESIRRVVREAMAKSAHDGKIWKAITEGHAIGALVRQEDGESYLVIYAEGYYDPNIVAIMLDAVSGVSSDDWIAEPGDVLGIEPYPGQVIFSTILPPQTLAQVLDEFESDFL